MKTVRNTHIFRHNVQPSLDRERQFLDAYDAYADAIFRHCFFRISDREQAKELTQDTFERTWKFLASGGELENIRAFLYRTAHNLIVDTYRRKSKMTVSYEQLLEVGFDPKASLDDPRDPVEFERVLNALSKLAKEDQKLITLRYVDGLGPKEIAEILNQSENVISVRLHRAINRARKLLETP